MIPYIIIIVSLLLDGILTNYLPFLINDLSIEYKCDCSKEIFTDGLSTLSKNDLEQIIEEDGKADTQCHFCNKKYHFSKEDLQEILKGKQ